MTVSRSSTHLLPPDSDIATRGPWAPNGHGPGLTPVADAMSKMEDCVIVLDKELNILFLNTVASRLLGLSPADSCRGLNMLSLEQTLVNEPVYRALQDAYKSQQYVCFEQYFGFSPVSLYEHHIYPTLEGFTLVGHDVTEVRLLGGQLQRALEELEQSERQLKLAVHGTGDGVWELDLTTRSLSLDQRGQEMFGRRLGNGPIDIDSWMALVHPEDLPGALEAMEAHLSGQAELFEIEHRSLTDGADAYRWFLARGRVSERGIDGTPLRLTGMHSDITDRKVIETQLVERTQQLDLALEASGMGIWRWDLLRNSFTVLKPGGPLTTHFATMPGDTDSLLQIVHPDDRKSLLDGLAGALNSGLPLQCEFRLVQRDGSVAWTSVLGRCTPGVAQLSLLGIDRDVSDAKWHERELLKARDDLASTLNAIPDVLIEVGLDFRLHGYHTSRPQLLAQSPPDFLGRTLAEVVPPDVAEVGEAAILEAHRHGYSTGRQYQLMTPDGPKWFELSVAPKLMSDPAQPRFVALCRDITDRKLFEEQLARTDALLKKAQQVAHLGSWVWVLPDDRMEWSDELYSVLSIDRQTPPAGLLHTLRSIVADDDRERLDALLTDARECHATGALELRTIHDNRDERVLWLDVSEATPIGEAGRWAISGTIQDITEHRRVESALQRNELLYRSMLNSSPDSIILTDINGVIELVSPTAVELFRARAPQGLEGSGILNLISEQERLRFGQQIARLFRPNRSRSQHKPEEYRILQSSGDFADVEVTMNLILDQEQKPTGIIVDIRDIALRREAEESLRNSEEKYRSLVETAHDLIWRCTLDGKFSYLNPAWEAMSGYPLPILSQMTLQNLATSELDGRRLIAALSAGAVRDWEITVRRQQGEDSILLVNGSQMRDFNGEVVGYQGTAMDVTSQREAEQARWNLEKQVQRAQKMESLGTLAGGIAHDFNNILTAIVGNLAMARMSIPEEHPATECLDEVQHATSRAVELVKQILTVGRKREGSPEILQVSSVVTEVAGLLQATLPPNIVISIACEPCPSVLADPTQLHQVLMNLCTNAWQAMNDDVHGLISLAVKAMTLSDDESRGIHPELLRGEYVVIAVSDNGSGIPPHLLGRIFEPFFTTKSQDRGTGLGLSVVDGIVHQHGGAIVVDSVVGEGTTFRVYLPASRESGS